MTTTPLAGPGARPAQRASLERRLDDIGWGLFLLMTGALWLVPEAGIPAGTWMIGTGLLLLALNAVRYFNGMRIHAVTTILGALALVGGLSDMAGVDLPLLALTLVIAGAILILRPMFATRR